MKPLFVRALNPEERKALNAGLRSPNSFTLRRAQILLSSARGLRVAVIAEHVGCSQQEVRNVLHAFEQRGLEALSARSHRPLKPSYVWDPAEDERLRAILHESPRAFGQPRSTWTLGLAAEVACQQGLTPVRVSIETIRRVLSRLEVGWRRARHWITSPDPQYAAKKNAGIG